MYTQTDTKLSHAKCVCDAHHIHNVQLCIYIKLGSRAHIKFHSDVASRRIVRTHVCGVYTEFLGHAAFSSRTHDMPFDRSAPRDKLIKRRRAPLICAPKGRHIKRTCAVDMTLRNAARTRWVYLRNFCCLTFGTYFRTYFSTACASSATQRGIIKIVRETDGRAPGQLAPPPRAVCSFMKCAMYKTRFSFATVCTSLSTIITYRVRRVTRGSIWVSIL